MTMSITFFRPDLLAVRQRLCEYDANIDAVEQMIAAGAPLDEVRAAYKRLRLEIKIAYADATKRADDLTEAERGYWQRTITVAAGQLVASGKSDDASEFQRSLLEAHSSFENALSTIDEALR
jgi:hypothetical protein